MTGFGLRSPLHAHLSFFFFASALFAGNVYQATVLRVIDGDTIQVRAAIWPSISANVSIRVRGIDAPEIRGRCAAERAKAIEAKALTTMLLPVGAEVILKNLKPDKYGGRYDSDVQTSDGKLISEMLIAAGVARPYGGGARAGWC